MLLVISLSLVTLSIYQFEAKAHIFHVLCRRMQGIDLTCFYKSLFYLVYIPHQRLWFIPLNQGTKLMFGLVF